MHQHNLTYTPITSPSLRVQRTNSMNKNVKRQDVFLNEPCGLQQGPEAHNNRWCMRWGDEVFPRHSESMMLWSLDSLSFLGNGVGSGIRWWLLVAVDNCCYSWLTMAYASIQLWLVLHAALPSPWATQSNLKEVSWKFPELNLWEKSLNSKPNYVISVTWWTMKFWAKCCLSFFIFFMAELTNSHCQSLV